MLNLGLIQQFLHRLLFLLILILFLLMLFSHQFLLQLALQSVLLIHHRVQDSIHLNELNFFESNNHPHILSLKVKKQILHYVGKFLGFSAKKLENTNRYK